MPQPNLASMHPVDIAATYERVSRVNLVPFEDEARSTAYAELGGWNSAAHAAADGPRVFAPFAELLQADSRKHDIARGLGGLGLIAVSTADIVNMNKADRVDYALALKDYHDGLVSRARVLATEGSIDSHHFQQKYPNTDQDWASTYASELNGLRDTLAATKLFASTAGTAPRRTAHQKATSPTKGWELHTNDKGRFALHKPTSRARRVA